MARWPRRRKSEKLVALIVLEKRQKQPSTFLQTKKRPCFRKTFFSVLVPRGGNGLNATVTYHKRQTPAMPVYAGDWPCSVKTVSGSFVQVRGSLYAIFTPGGWNGFVPETKWWLAR